MLTKPNIYIERVIESIQMHHMVILAINLRSKTEENE